ncbi:MAG TPA: methyltransferase domain-containing protein [Burkholderiaceae bacterium]|nr:methyltransferase domain-containing protein [Burkholderiaceae bacterium]
MATIHAAAATGFAAEAQAYARGRPEYPVALHDWLANVLGVGPGRSVVDLGAGTGKFTKLLVASGADVSAIEPVDEMRALLARNLPAVRTLAGTAQSMPIAEAAADAVVCAQAFHWFAEVAALREIHRVLKPGGALGLVWNVRDASVDWVRRITEIISPYEGDAPRHHKGEWRKPFDSGLFSPLEASTFRHEHVGPPREVILDRFLSVSFIAALPAAEKDLVAQRLSELAATHPDLRGRDAIAFPYVTEAYVCRRA